MKGTGLNGYFIAQAAIGIAVVVANVVSIALGYKGSQQQMIDLQKQAQTMFNNPPKAA